MVPIIKISTYQLMIRGDPLLLYTGECVVITRTKAYLPTIIERLSMTRHRRGEVSVCDRCSKGMAAGFSSMWAISADMYSSRVDVCPDYRVRF